MDKPRHYDVEGAPVDIPVRYDACAQAYVGVYDDVIAHPVFTPEGRPILFIGEDACEHAEPAGAEECLDCASCRFFRRVPQTLIGVCGHDAHRRLDWTDDAGETALGDRPADADG